MRPLYRDREEELEVDAGHGVRHYGLVVGVEEVVDCEFGRKAECMQRNASFYREVAHEIARE